MPTAQAESGSDRTNCPVPESDLSMHDQKIEVQTAAGAAPNAVPVADAGFVVGQLEFERRSTARKASFATGAAQSRPGISLVEATQKADTFTGAISLVRVEPSVNWLNPSNRTLFDFSGSYGKVSQPGVPDIKTDIVHADAERDEYVTDVAGHPRGAKHLNLGYQHPDGCLGGAPCGAGPLQFHPGGLQAAAHSRRRVRPQFRHPGAAACMLRRRCQFDGAGRRGPLARTRIAARGMAARQRHLR